MASNNWSINDINASKIEARLRHSLDGDHCYNLENSAKLRSVNTTSSYEEFRQLVLGSHLKPQEKSDKSKQKPTSIWNSFTASATSACKRNSKSSLSSNFDSENSVYASDFHYDLSNPPTTTEGLLQLWERLDLADRLELLRSLNRLRIDQLSAGLVAEGLLGDVITTLLAFSPNITDVVMVVLFLQSLSQSKRFSLSVQLISVDEKWAWGRLMEKIQSVLTEKPQDLAEMDITEWTLVQLKAKYNL